MFGQTPEAGSAAEPIAGADLMQQLELLGWVDRSALAVLLVFFVLGLFKGLFWQVSRIAILLVSYVVAGQFGGDVGRWLGRTLGGHAATPDPAAAEPADTTLYLSYLLVFLVALVALSLIAIQIQKLVKKTGLGFFDRVGGGLFGVATGACTVLSLLFVVNMFFRGTVLWQEAEASHCQRLSRSAIDWLGPRVPDDLRKTLELAPLNATAGAGTGPGGGDADGSGPVGDTFALPGAAAPSAPPPQTPPKTPPQPAGTGSPRKQ
ncbi:MAG: CvpA family protein [Planctomycetes bacterium]|nr:CvpA family protein [Planctomycetota bacterium]